MNKGLTLFKITSSALVVLVLSSCVPNAGNSLRARDSSNTVTGNTNVAVGQGRVLSDNPIILTQNSGLSDSYDLNKLLTTVPITNDAFLSGTHSFYGLQYYFEVRENKDRPSALQTTDGKWAFKVNTPEFLQVNTFYHLNKVIDLFYQNLTQSYSLAYDLSAPYDSALPLGLLSSSSAFNGSSVPLTAYSDCDVANNAYFDRANQTLCFGYLEGHSLVKWAQDSSVIFHEAGHYFQKMQLNLRNYTGLQKVDLGSGAYDEAGSIGEGLSDYYSYFVNGRTHFAEWGAGRFLNSSRPLSENDSLHISGLSTDADQRLSYPQYIGYDPNRPTIPVEDIHLSGMIISHYLVALTEDIENKCSMSKKEASNLVVHLISETLAEHGDLSSNGTKSISSQNKINLNPAYSFDWFSKVNPINYRSFMQTFAKNLLNSLGKSGLTKCNGTTYAPDSIESLIDQYGLLLFRNYNENRNLSNLGAFNNSAVNELNRKKSVLIKKDLLILDPTTNASSAFVIDNRDQIKKGITSLQSSGLIGSLSTQTPSDLSFNNNNGKVSPGEVVALAINLYNNSNSPMGGVQILANDWDHADATSGSPCKFKTTISNDQWPLSSEGGAPCSTTVASVTTDYAPQVDSADDFAPVCFMQSNENSSTKWVSQSEFKTKMALNSSLCLDPNAGKEKECFIRAIKGADQAYFSKLNPKSTWGQTMADPTSGKAPTFEWGNVILFEVSKRIPPGTVIDCRLRLRFTNCDDCYHDQDLARKNLDYTDTDYNGPRPYKIIHLQIPITD